MFLILVKCLILIVLILKNCLLNMFVGYLPYLRNFSYVHYLCL